MTLLPHPVVQALHAAAVELHLDRTTLLSGMSPAFAASLPAAPTPGAQCLLDLHRLNTTSPLLDGSLPLRSWLEMALVLASDQPRKSVFEDALARLRTEEKVPVPSIAQGSQRRSETPGGRSSSESSEPIMIYVSFAPKDAAAVDKLRDHLVPWMSPANVQLWHRGLVRPGRDVNAEVTEHLRRAQIVVLMVSADYLGWAPAGEEIRIAMEGHAAQQKRVIPILVRPCIWEGSAFSRLSVLPADGRPLAQRPRADEAYAEISMGIQLVVKDLPIAPDPTRGPGKKHWLDIVPYAAHLPQAIAARNLLVDAYPSTLVMRNLAGRVPIHLGNWHDQHGCEPAWDSLLELAAAQGKLRALIEAILADPNVAGYHARLRKLRDDE